MKTTLKVSVRVLGIFQDFLTLELNEPIEFSQRRFSVDLIRKLISVPV